MSTMYLKLKQLKPLTAPDFPTLLFFFFCTFGQFKPADARYVRRLVPH